MWHVREFIAAEPLSRLRKCTTFAFGGDSVGIFADLYMREIAGPVLIDADANDLEPKAMREEDRRGRIAIVSQLRDCRNAIAEHKSLPALRSRPGQPQHTPDHAGTGALARTFRERATDIRASQLARNTFSSTSRRL
jgi:hypothetical protein